MITGGRDGLAVYPLDRFSDLHFQRGLFAPGREKENSEFHKARDLPSHKTRNTVMITRYDGHNPNIHYLMDRQMNKQNWRVHTMEYSAIKRKDVPTMLQPG